MIGAETHKNRRKTQLLPPGRRYDMTPVDEICTGSRIKAGNARIRGDEGKIEAQERL